MPLKFLRKFIKIEASSGILLIIATLLALALENSPLQGFYRSLFHAPLQFKFLQQSFSTDFLFIVNDGLMAIFFLLVSLEIKRELLIGELNSRRKALLPGFAAIGGMLFPALIFFLFNHAHAENYPGWAIPTATDIAFSLGILALLGSRIPMALKTFLMALAIIDDLGAIVIIAVFYTQHIALNYLGFAGALTAALVLLNVAAINRFWLYGILGALLWYCLLKAGVHATIAGVITGFVIPLSSKKQPQHSLLKQLEHQLHPWVAFGILPLFALANAGLSFSEVQSSDLTQPLVFGIAAGLFFGKQLGVMSASWLAIKCKLAELPGKTNWRQLYGVACLCGIGFTMSLFIGTLAFDDGNAAHMELIRLGVLLGSVLAGIVGYGVLLKRNL